MKAKEIKDLIDFLANSGLDEVNLETEEIKLHIKRQRDVAPVQPAAAAPVALPPAEPAPAPAPVAPSPEPAAKEESASFLTIKSPMIGTFYRQPNPESDSFVSVGDSVKEGDVVCIIEAMKLFNEIESEVSGKIVKILVENATPVEYDQPLFLVDPS